MAALLTTKDINIAKILTALPLSFSAHSTLPALEMPVCLSVCLPACLPACLSACLPACLSACLPACILHSRRSCLPACAHLLFATAICDCYLRLLFTTAITAICHCCQPHMHITLPLRGYAPSITHKHHTPSPFPLSVTAAWARTGCCATGIWTAGSSCWNCLATRLRFGHWQCLALVTLCTLVCAVCQSDKAGSMLGCYATQCVHE